MQNVVDDGPGDDRPGRNIENLGGAGGKRDDIGRGVPCPVAEPSSLEREPETIGV